MSYPVSDLTDHTGYWIRLLSNDVSNSFARKIEEEGVTVAEWSFMRTLFDEERSSPTALADKMGMTRGAISKLADRLTAKGLVMRTASKVGRRGQSLSLTPEGREKVPNLARLADQNDAEYFGMLTREDRDAIDRIVRALVKRRGLTAPPVN